MTPPFPNLAPVVRVGLERTLAPCSSYGLGPYPTHTGPTGVRITTGTNLVLVLMPLSSFAVAFAVYPVILTHNLPNLPRLVTGLVG